MFDGEATLELKDAVRDLEAPEQVLAVIQLLGGAPGSVFGGQYDNGGWLATISGEQIHVVSWVGGEGVKAEIVSQSFRRADVVVYRRWDPQAIGHVLRGGTVSPGQIVIDLGEKARVVHPVLSVPVSLRRRDETVMASLNEFEG